MSLLLNWFKQLAIHGRIEESDYKTLERTYRDPKEVNMLITAIKREKRQLYNEGKKEGEKKGVKKGKFEQQLEFARRMFSNGEPLDKIKQYTGLSTGDLKRLKRTKAQPLRAARNSHTNQSNLRMARQQHA